MSISPISASLPVDVLAGSAGAAESSAPGFVQPTPEDLRKAAGQFEAVLVRQLLGPAMKSMLSAGSIGGSAPGSDVYGYLMTDVMADALTAGSGIGLSHIIELQLGVPASAAKPPHAS